MLWKNRRGSGNLIDRRGMGGGIGVGTLVIGAIIYSLMGGNPLEYVAMNSGNTLGRGEKTGTEEQKQFVSVVLADTEDVWNNIFKQNGEQYQEPKLVLFSHSVRSACGMANSAVGPFYCPADQQVYIDLSFFDQLSSRLGASGDFAAAYVVAHEVGHHVQHLLGIDREVRARQETLDERSRNRLSVMMELQADCLAGVWARQTQDSKQVLEKGDMEEALNAASAVGDDKLQEASQGQVVPDSFTHGSSDQRIAAFKTGFEGNGADACLGTEGNQTRQAEEAQGDW